ncbi:MAG: nitronate monooxygenase [Deltaproteobacteria bacterium]|nr:nitronate monooxygenase [Deltaproteobacteria bacterium]MBI3295391.1 nitronate monooxygenase [Deltaproteobacteria bacterium]
METRFTKLAKVEYPIICGAMYPCSNPELVAAVSDAGGLGIIQPISLTYVHEYDLRKGIEKIRSLTKKPVGFNVIVEKNAKVYEDRMKAWVDIAVEMGVRFFITALGNPTWVIERVKPKGGVVFHDVTERKWADKVVRLGIDGLICVNNRAGGHAGSLDPQGLYDQLKPLGLPLICAGGIGNEKDFQRALAIGYDGVQMGTRFIATLECNSHKDYKDAIIAAAEGDIVKTERVTGVPLSVIRTPYVDRVGLKVGPLARWLFRHRKTRHWIRLFYNVRAIVAMKRSSLKGVSTKDYYQAGKSVEGIDRVEPVKAVIDRFVAGKS